MEILGLLDTLESLIIDSFKVPLTGKVLIEEPKLLALIDKIRLVAQSGEDFAKKAIDIGEREETVEQKEEHEVIKRAVSQVTTGIKEGLSRKELEAQAAEIIEQAYEVAKEVRSGADKYADEVLANLEATSAKILRSIRSGRERLTKTTGGES